MEVYLAVTDLPTLFDEIQGSYERFKVADQAMEAVFGQLIDGSATRGPLHLRSNPRLVEASRSGSPHNQHDCSAGQSKGQQKKRNETHDPPPPMCARLMPLPFPQTLPPNHSSLLSTVM